MQGCSGDLTSISRPDTWDFSVSHVAFVGQLGPAFPGEAKYDDASSVLDAAPTPVRKFLREIIRAGSQAGAAARSATEQAKLTSAYCAGDAKLARPVRCSAYRADGPP